MSWASIPQAHYAWCLLKGQADPPPSAERVEQAEVFILKEFPTTQQEAACILDVVCSYYGDARCDGLDLAALHRIRAFLTSD